jgi:hypothetical protein
MRRLGARWKIRNIHCFDSMNEKSHITQERLYSEERMSIGNHERIGRTVEEHGETEATEKSSQQFQAYSWLPRKES